MGLLTVAAAEKAAPKTRVVAATRILDEDRVIPEGEVLKGKLAEDMLAIGHARREPVPAEPDAPDA